MEINNRSHFSTDAYLLSQQKYKADQQSMSPLEKSNKEKKVNREETSETKKISAVNEDSQTHSNFHIASTKQANLNQTLNSNKTQRNQSNNQDTSGYKVSPHNPQIAHKAERAVATYNSVENSQYGQELVNRIELLV